MSCMSNTAKCGGTESGCACTDCNNRARRAVKKGVNKHTKTTADKKGRRHGPRTV